MRWLACVQCNFAQVVCVFAFAQNYTATGAKIGGQNVIQKCRTKMHKNARQRKICVFVFTQTYSNSGAKIGGQKYHIKYQTNRYKKASRI